MDEDGLQMTFRPEKDVISKTSGLSYLYTHIFKFTWKYSLSTMLSFGEPGKR